MLKRENISDKLADAIGRKIIYNELKSGEIIVETQISKEWDISRSPVRDALHILKNQWLLEKSPKGLYMVPVLNAEYIENFYDAMNMFYQYTFSRATKYISEKDSSFILSVVEKIEKSVGYGDTDVYLKGVTAFGLKVLKIAKNPIIEKSASELMPTAERIQFAAYQIDRSYPERSLEHLWGCYENLKKRAPQKAAKSFSLFANNSREIIIDYFNKDKKEKT